MAHRGQKSVLAGPPHRLVAGFRQLQFFDSKSWVIFDRGVSERLRGVMSTIDARR